MLGMVFGLCGWLAASLPLIPIGRVLIDRLHSEEAADRIVPASVAALAITAET